VEDHKHLAMTHQAQASKAEPSDNSGVQAERMNGYMPQKPAEMKAPGEIDDTADMMGEPMDPSLDVAEDLAEEEEEETMEGNGPEVNINVVISSSRAAELRSMKRAAFDARAEASGDPELYRFSFSSEQPVERWFGTEVLSHDPSAPDFSRLNGNAAPYLWNHNSEVVLGKVERAWQGADGRGYCEVRWSPNTKAAGSEEAKRRTDIEAGIIPSVSFMYSIDDVVEADGVMLVRRWTPLEISSVPIPADISVGQSRSAAETPINALHSISSDDSAIRGSNTVSISAMTEHNQNLDDVRSAERERITTISALADHHGVKELGQKLISDGRSIEQAREAVLNAIGARKEEFTGLSHTASGDEVGLSDKEIRQFSFMRIARHLADPADRAAREAAGLELAASRAAESKYGRSAKGILIPNEVLTRDQNVGTGSAGGYGVATTLLTGSFIELVRNRSAILPYATVLGGLQGNVDIPRKTSVTQAYWLGESVAATETQMALGQIAMTPKSIGAYVDITRRLMIQSSLDAESLIRSDLATSVALEADRVGLYGSGSASQPLGLKNITGIGSVTLTGGVTKTINSTSYDFGTYAQYIDLETSVAANNLDIGSQRYLVSAYARGSLKQQPKIGSTFPEFVYGSDNTINGYEAVVSNQLIGSNTFFGSFENAVFGFWSGLDVTVDPYSLSTKGSVRIVAFQDLDFAVRYPGAFAFGAS